MVGYLHKWESYVVETLFNLELWGLLPTILLLTTLLKKNGRFEEIVYEWSMGTTKAQSDKNQTRSWEINVWPFVLGQSDKSSFNIEPLYMVLRLVDSVIVPTMPFVYELMQMMKENLIRQQARELMFEIIKGHWEKTLRHPLHIACN